MAGLALDRIDPIDVGLPDSRDRVRRLFSRIARAADSGIVPMRAMPSAASASISNQMRRRFSGAQMAAISGRV